MNAGKENNGIIIAYSVLIMLYIVMGCAGREKKSTIEFEGLHGKRDIRIFVQVRANAQDPYCKGEKCRQLIINSARERCIMILHGMLENVRIENVDIQGREDIATAIDAPRIKKIECNGITCGGFVDFRIGDMMYRNINKIGDTKNDNGNAAES